MGDRANAFNGHQRLVDTGIAVLRRCETEAAIATAGWWLECSGKTIQRMRDCVLDCEAQWSLARFLRLQLMEQEVYGTRILADALAEWVADTKPVGRPLEVERDLSREIGDEAALIARCNAMLSDGRADERECAEAIPAIEQRIAALQQLRADLEAKALAVRR